MMENSALDHIYISTEPTNSTTALISSISTSLSESPQKETLRHLISSLALWYDEPHKLCELQNRFLQQITYRELVPVVIAELQQHNFTGFHEYKDSLGGLTIDSFRESDRVTCVVATKYIQVLSHIKDVVQYEVFMTEDNKSAQAIAFLKNFLSKVKPQQDSLI